jgi:hypothetical protein
VSRQMTRDRCGLLSICAHETSAELNGTHATSNGVIAEISSRSNGRSG